MAPQTAPRGAARRSQCVPQVVWVSLRQDSRMRLALHLGFSVLCSVASTATVWAQPSAGTGIYTCVDASGKRFTADRPIPQCADREQRVLGPTGVERSRIGPALTEVEMAQLLELRRQEELLQLRAQEQRRRDAALLARYPEQALHDAARQAALQQVDAMRVLAYQRLVELDKEQHQWEQELQFYKQNPSKAPARLRLALQDVKSAQQDVRTLLTLQADEAQRINLRFDAELQSLKALWKSQRMAP